MSATDMLRRRSSRVSTVYQRLSSLTDRHRATLLEWGAMAAITLLAAGLDLWHLGASGYGNLYYSAAVRSMAQSWHTFFFVSYDPGGFVSVDKPPLGLWAQVVSVKLLGFNGFALLLPEALAGALSVIVLWRVVRRSFGAVAGTLAALALAVSPVNVVTNRDNVLEPLLILTLLLAAWAALIASERASLRWLLVCAALIGLGFNIKTLEAWLILPALAALYLLGARIRLRARFAHLALACALMLVISFAWMTAVDLTPASQRPYVGSSTTNSELELALSYNGAARLLGGFSPLRWFGATEATKAHGPAARPSAPAPSGAPARDPQRPVSAARDAGRLPHSHPAATPPSATGQPGPLRLFQSALGSQVSWLLPLALTGGALLVGSTFWPPTENSADTSAEPSAATDVTPSRRRAGLTSRRRWAHGLILWGLWLLAAGVCFSLARSINAYYVAVLAPAICALAGAGATALWRAYCGPLLTERARVSDRFRRSAPGARGERIGMALSVALELALPLAVLATLAEQATLLHAAPLWRPGLATLLSAAALILSLALVALRAVVALHARVGQAHAHLHAHGGRAGALAAALATVARASLFTAPPGWSLSSLTWGNAGGWPVAGPEFASAAPVKRPLVDTVTVRYLLAHRGDDRYLVGALNSYITAPLIVATGQPVMDMGGFSGSDPILTAQTLARLVAQDNVHLFLLPATNVTAAQRAALFNVTPTANAARRPTAGGAIVSAPATRAQATTYTNSLTRWISLHCTPVPPREWSSADYVTQRLGAWELFTCTAREA